MLLVPSGALVKNNQSLSKLKLVSEKHHRQTRSVMHPMQNTTNKLVSYHLSHINYRSIELRHSFHQIDSIALSQAGVNQLPGSSDVNNRAVSISSTVSDNCRNF